MVLTNIMQVGSSCSRNRTGWVRLRGSKGGFHVVQPGEAAQETGKRQGVEIGSMPAACITCLQAAQAAQGQDGSELHMSCTASAGMLLQFGRSPNMQQGKSS